MESLFAYSCLWICGFCSTFEYNAYLDTLFLENPNDELLLELEECSKNCQDSFVRLQRYFEYEKSSFDISMFGKTLLAGLKIVYKANRFNINEFGRKCYELWKKLPISINMQEPFHTLSYADDCLCYGDEEQTRKLYEKVFEFYK